MADVNNSSADQELDFDKADFAASQEENAASCQSCSENLSEQYFSLNGAPLCGACREQFEEQILLGAGMAAPLRALVVGSIAGALGFGLYYGVMAVTGYELALIAIAVGFVVARAIAWANRGHGGIIYQAMGAIITLISIAASQLTYATSESDVNIFDVEPSILLDVLIDINSDPISLIIVGVAIWETIRQNKKLVLNIEGPFTRQAGAAPNSA